MCQGRTSEVYLAEISVRPPRELYIFIIEKYIHSIKEYGKYFILFLKKVYWVEPGENENDDIPVNSPRALSTFIMCLSILPGSKYPIIPSFRNCL